MGLALVLNRLLNRETLHENELQSAFSDIMRGDCDDAQVAALITALKIAGESASDLFAAATAMRAAMDGVEIKSDSAIDIVGTGGDGANLFNVSTAAAIVCAAAGIVVAKHGNRSVSSSSGAADVLAAAGVNLSLNSAQVARCVDELGVGFMFAPNHHRAMKNVASARASLGQRSIFNLLGPLTNPARVTRHVVGVYSEQWVNPIAHALQRLGAQHALVVHADDGLDEISLATPTSVCEVRDGELFNYHITPEQLGIEREALTGLEVTSPEQSLELFMTALEDADSKAAKMVALNAGAAIYVGGLATSVEDGVRIALDVIASGVAGQKLKDLVELTKLMGAL